MKLAEQILSDSVECTPVQAPSNESVSSSSSINVKIGDNEVGMNVSFNVYKCYQDSNGNPIKEDDVEMQLKMQKLFKSDVDVFIASVGEKLKALKGI